MAAEHDSGIGWQESGPGAVRTESPSAAVDRPRTVHCSTAAATSPCACSPSTSRNAAFLPPAAATWPMRAPTPTSSAATRRSACWRCAAAACRRSSSGASTAWTRWPRSRRQRPDPEVRRPRGPRRRLLVPRLHRRHAVVADRRRPRAAPRLRAGSPGAGRRASSARARLAAGAGAPDLPAAAAERGQRLGRHHAALGLRAVHQRAVGRVKRRFALPHAKTRPSLQPPVPPLPARPARVPPRAAAAALRAPRPARPGPVPELRQPRLRRRRGRRLRQPAGHPVRRSRASPWGTRS
jgi:hypothetical protein